jgi:hypothetical protein
MLPTALVVALLAGSAPLLAGPAVGFVIQAPAATTGVPFNFTVRAVDLSGNTATTYGGTVHVTSSDPLAVLPADHTFTGSEAGIATLTATLHGDYTTQTLTVTDTSNGSIHGSAGVMVKDPDHVVWFTSDAPRNPVRNSSVPVVIVAENRDYQRVASYRGTVHFSADDSSVDLPADYTFTAADAGTHTFSLVFHRGYHHQIWLTDIDSGAGGSSEVWVTCPDITLTAVNNGPVCPGSQVTLTALTNAANPSFNWHTSHASGAFPTYTTQTAVAPYSASWEVYMSDADTGCFASTQTAVAVEPPPDVTAPQSTSGDFTASIAGDPNGPYSNVQWTIDGGTIVDGAGTPTITIHPTSGASRVSLAVTATRTSTNCTRSESNIYVQVNGPPLSGAIATPSSVCRNATNVAASVADAGSGATYNWSVSNGLLTGGQGTRSITYDAASTGPIHLAVTVQRGIDSASGSKDVAISGPSALVSGGGGLCPDQTATITASLNGIPPFAVTWSDGVTQSEINSFSVSRTLLLDAQASFTITHIADASCEGTATGEAHFTLLAHPAIVTGPADTSVMGGTPATLTVIAAGDHLSFAWFEGRAGDTSKLVMTGSNSFTTPPLWSSTSYWVRVQSPCGEVSSRAALVTPVPRRRPTRR